MLKQIATVIETMGQCFYSPKYLGYARPLILFILPGSVNWIGRKVLLTGQENTTSPPPSGGAPLFTICKSES